MHTNADNSTQFQADSLPAPSIADLECWFADELADYLHEHNGVLPAPVKCDLTDQSWVSEDAGAAVTPDVASPLAANQPGDEYGIVSVEPSFFNPKPVQPPITDPTVMQHRLAKHAEERWTRGDTNLRTLEEAVLTVGRQRQSGWADVCRCHSNSPGRVQEAQRRRRHVRAER